MLGLVSAAVALQQSVNGPETIGRVMSISPAAARARQLVKSMSLNEDLTPEVAAAQSKTIDELYRTYPLAYPLWREWQVMMPLILNQEEQALKASKSYAPTTLAMDWMLEDSLFGPKLKSPEWGPIFADMSKRRDKAYGELQSARYGLVPNYARSQMLSMRLWGKDVYSLLTRWDAFRQPTKTGVWTLFTYSDAIGTAPYLVYVPKRYDARKRSPLMMYFYGGWINAPLSRRWESREYLIDNPTFAPRNFLEEHNMVGVVPMLNGRLAPHTKGGVRAIHAILASVKSMVNVDDDRVYASGFSDGGTTCYELSRSDPTPFASLYPMNGWPGMKLNMRNIGNRPITGYFGEFDELYTAKNYARYFSLYGASRQTGWQPVLVKGVGHESMFYTDSVMPDIFRQVKGSVRNPFPTHIEIEGASGDLNRLDWLESISVDPNLAAQPWHNEVSFTRTDAKTGETSQVVCNAGNGMLVADRAGNSFSIQASRVTEFRLFLSPRLVDLSKPVVVTVNGKEVFNDLAPTLSEGEMLQQMMLTMDRVNLPKAILNVKVTYP